MKLNQDKGKSPEDLAWERGYAQGLANAKPAIAAAGHAPMPLDEMNSAWLEVGADVAGLSWERFVAAYARARAHGITAKGDSDAG